MSVSHYIKKQTIFYGLMFFIGVFALFLGYGLKFETHAMTGVALGFIPVGLGGLLIMMYSRKSPAMTRNIEIESDERNTWIRYKSGHTAFWITLWYIFAFTMLSNIAIIPLTQFGISTLIFMAVIYFLLVFINSNKY